MAAAWYSWAHAAMCRCAAGSCCSSCQQPWLPASAHSAADACSCATVACGTSQKPGSQSARLSARQTRLLLRNTMQACQSMPSQPPSQPPSPPAGVPRPQHIPAPAAAPPLALLALLHLALLLLFDQLLLQAPLLLHLLQARQLRTAALLAPRCAVPADGVLLWPSAAQSCCVRCSLHLTLVAVPPAMLTAGCLRCLHCWVTPAAVAPAVAAVVQGLLLQMHLTECLLGVPLRLRWLLA